MIGKRIADIRKQKHLSQTIIAKKANIANSTLCDIEKGRINPSIKTLEKIAEALEVPVGKFFLHTDSVDNETASFEFR